MPTKQKQLRSKLRNVAVGTTRHSPELTNLRRTLGLPRRIFARLTGYSERSIAAWESGQSLAGPARQRLTEIQRLQQALSRVMKSEFIGTWLQQPNPTFDGLKPLEVIERGEIDRIWQLVHTLESGEPG